MSPLRKIATSSPGTTKPATRPVSDSVTEMAICPSGTVSSSWSPCDPNLPAMICSLGKTEESATCAPMPSMELTAPGST